MALCINRKKLLQELSFRTSRSSGPGGQHVNKVETRVQLLFDIRASEVLSETEKEKLFSKLPGRINRNGILRVVSSKGRSQSANKRMAVDRFMELLHAALAERKKRVSTTPTLAGRLQRLEQKKKHSEKKKRRRLPPEE